MQMSVRFDGIIENLINKLVKLGYFKSKNDALRAGILELGKEYNLLPKDKEIEKRLLKLKIEGLERKRKNGKLKTISLKKIKKKYPELEDLEVWKCPLM